MNYWAMRKREDNGEKLEFKNEKEEYWYNYAKKAFLLTPFYICFMPILLFFLTVSNITYNMNNYILGVIISIVICGTISLILTIINIYIYKKVYTLKLRYEISFNFAVGLSWFLTFAFITPLIAMVSEMLFYLSYILLFLLGIGYGCVMTWLVYNKKYKKLKKETLEIAKKDE